jgi:group I intron endonuclease
MSQDFDKGKIYKITNDYNDDIYIGSTCDTLNRRFTNHKRDYRKERCKDRPIYKLMNEIGYERFRIELIENYPCVDKYQLRQREGHFIRQFGTLNKLIAGNIVDTKEYQKEYRENNKEHFKDYDTKYYIENKEKIQEHKKEFYEANKEKIQEHKKEKITCECGCIVCRVVLSRHKRSIKHQEFLKTISTPIIH